MNLMNEINAISTPLELREFYIRHNSEEYERNQEFFTSFFNKDEIQLFLNNHALDLIYLYMRDDLTMTDDDMSPIILKLASIALTENRTLTYGIGDAYSEIGNPWSVNVNNAVQYLIACNSWYLETDEFCVDTSKALDVQAFIREMKVKYKATSEDISEMLAYICRGNDDLIEMFA